jgi:hypothetical protein
MESPGAHRERNAENFGRSLSLRETPAPAGEGSTRSLSGLDDNLQTAFQKNIVFIKILWYKDGIYVNYNYS